MSKHTPGPWVKSGLDWIGSNGEKVIVCDGPAFGSARKFPSASANARLISQAPRLLEALESAVRLLSGIEGISRNNLFALADEEIESAMAVIKAAKGE